MDGSRNGGCHCSLTARCPLPWMLRHTRALCVCLLLWLTILADRSVPGVTATTPEAAALELRREECGEAMTRCLSLDGGMEEDCEDCVEQCTQLARSAEPGPGIDEDVADDYARTARATVRRCQEELDDIRMSSTSNAFAAGVSFGSA